MKQEDFVTKEELIQQNPEMEISDVNFPALQRGAMVRAYEPTPDPSLARIADALEQLVDRMPETQRRLEHNLRGTIGELQLQLVPMMHKQTVIDMATAYLIEHARDPGKAAAGALEFLKPVAIPGIVYNQTELAAPAADSDAATPADEADTAYLHYGGNGRFA